MYWLSLIGAAVGLGLTVWALAKMDMTDGHGGSAGLWRWWLALGVGWLSLTGLARWLWRRDGPVLFRWRDVLLLVFVAIAVRVVVVATSQPQLSDDVYRYVVDGQAVAHGDSPYVATPLQRAQQLINDGAPMWPGEDEVLAHVNNPELHTIYLPTSQWVFGFSATVANNTGAVSASEQVEIQRYVLSLIDVLVICLLYGHRLAAQTKYLVGGVVRLASLGGHRSGWFGTPRTNRAVLSRARSVPCRDDPTRLVDMDCATGTFSLRQTDHCLYCTSAAATQSTTSLVGRAGAGHHRLFFGRQPICVCWK